MFDAKIIFKSIRKDCRIIFRITYSILKIKLRIILFIIYTLSEKKKNILIKESNILFYADPYKIFDKYQIRFLYFFFVINYLRFY